MEWNTEFIYWIASFEYLFVENKRKTKTFNNIEDILIKFLGNIKILSFLNCNLESSMIISTASKIFQISFVLKKSRNRNWLNLMLTDLYCELILNLSNEFLSD